MSLYDDFEKRFSSGCFFSGWLEIEPRPKAEEQTCLKSTKKDLETLQKELETLEESITTVTEKQLQLQNLSKVYPGRNHLI